MRFERACGLRHDIFWCRFAKPTENFFHTAKAEFVKMWGGREEGSSLSITNFFDRVKTKMLQQCGRSFRSALQT